MADSNYKISAEVDPSKAIEGIKQLLEKINDLEVRIKAIKKSARKEKDPSALADLLREQTALETEQNKLRADMKVLEKARKESTKVVKDEIQVDKAKSGSLKDLRDRLKDLKAIYVGMSKAERDSKVGRQTLNDIRHLTKEISKLENKMGVFGRNVGNYKSAFGGLFNKLFVGAALGFTTLQQMFVGIGNKLKSMVTDAVSFNREVSRLSAILMKSKGEISLLTAEAKRLGSETRYTATEVVQLQVELAKLGYGRGAIAAMSESVLYLAQATGSNLAEAAALAGAALRIFGDDATQLNKYVDQMAVATAKSALSFDYIKTALPIVGGAAQMFNFTLQDTLSLLGQLANSGMEASMAATATRNIFLKLADSNGLLSKTLGKTPKSLEELLDGLDELRAKGADLNDALELTNVRAAVAFTRFMNSAQAARELSKSMDYAAMSEADFQAAANEAGVTVKELKEAMSVCNGTAREMAEIMEDNLGGDVTRLSSAWEDFTISLNGSQGPLRDVIDKLRQMVVYLGNIVRSIDESENMQVSKMTKLYTETSEFNDIIDDDVARYKKRLNELVSEGMQISKAMAQAQNEIIEEINRETNDKLIPISDAKHQFLVNVRMKVDPNSKKSFEELLDDKKQLEKELNYPLIFADSQKERITGRITAINNLTSAWNDYSVARSKVEAQDLRISAFMSRANKAESGDGLGVEDDAKRRKRIERERQAEKALLDAKKTYNKAALDQTKENDDAILIDYEDMQTSVRIFMQDALDKQRAIVEEKYQAEYDTIKYQISEQEKLLADASEREKTLRIAAIDVLNKALVEKEKDKQTALQNLRWEYIKKDVDYLIENYNMRLSAIISGTKAEIEERKKILDEQERKEIAELEIRATKDSRIQTELEERKKMIADKYAKLRLDVRRQEIHREMKMIQNEYQSKILGTGSGVERARLNEEEKYKELIKLEKEQRLLWAEIAMDENLAAEYAAKHAKAVADANAATRERMKAENDQNMQPLSFAADVTMNGELAQLRAKAELANAIFENMKREQFDTVEEYNQAIHDAEINAFEANRAVLEKEFEIRAATATSISNMFGVISDAISSNMEENKESVRLQKILSLASVYLAQGVAIANAIKNASQSSITVWDMAAQIASGITTVVSSTASAISAIKKAQFAKGAVNINGAGTGTSDSIPAMISNGESVMTARATDMFGGILLLMNKVASQPHVTLPTQYARYNPVQSSGDARQQAVAFREAVENVSPVVSVREIEDVKNRVRVIENIETV